MPRTSPTIRRALIGLWLAGVLAGCGGEKPTGAAPGPRAYKVGAVLPMFSHPFFVAQKRGLEEEAKKLGINLDVRDGKDDDLKQIAQIEALINQKVDLIILCARDEDALVRAVQSANAAQIPVIALNRRVSGGETLCYIGADDVEAGRQQARALIDALGPKGGKYLYLQGAQGSTPQRQRSKGLDEVLKGHPEIVRADDRYAEFQADAAKKVMTVVARRFPPGEIRAIVAQNDEMAVPAAEVAQAERWKDVAVIGLDGTRSAFDAIRAGTMRATVLQDAAEQGALAVRAARDYLGHSGKVVPPAILTKLPIITKANVDAHGPSY